MSRKEAADAREKQTGMRQSGGAMIAKIAFGALFVISGLTTDWRGDDYTADPIGSMLLSIVIGLALIAWGVVPWWKAKRQREEDAARAEAERKAAEARRLNAPKLCPACGATTRGECCEYCGTPLKDDA